MSSRQPFAMRSRLNALSLPAASASGAGVWQAVLNILVLLLFSLLVLSAYRHFAATHSLKSLGILAVNTLFLSLFLLRRPAKSETRSKLLGVLAVAGTALPMLLRPSSGGFETVGAALQLVGVVMVAAGLLSLRRSFAVVPANRGIRQGGLYRLVRHPLYISELLTLLGVVLASPTVLNWTLWVCECGLQFARACAEESFLADDPTYQAYRERVRYRLLPGLL